LELYNTLTEDNQESMDLIQQHVEDKETMQEKLQEEREQAE